MSLPLHFVYEKNKQVVFHLKGGDPITMAIPTQMNLSQMTTKGLLVAAKKHFISFHIIEPAYQPFNDFEPIEEMEDLLGDPYADIRKELDDPYADMKKFFLQFTIIKL